MSGISSVAGFVQPTVHTTRQTVEKSPDKEGNSGAGRADLREAPAPLPARSLNLVA